jgi:iron-sulfur cluster repair protein YtfE (RIC family)
MTAFAQLDMSHRRHHERLEALTGAAERLAAGVGGMTDLEELIDAAAFFARSTPRHFGDEDEVVFPALARLRPDATDALAALTAEHAGLTDGFAQLGAQIARWNERVPAPADARGFADAAAAVAARYRDHAAREDALFATHRGALDPEDAALLEALEARRGGGGRRRG